MSQESTGVILARLVVDLPQKEAPVSAELGRVLLLQFTSSRSATT